MKLKASDISVEKSFPSGMLVLSAIVNGYRVQRRYMGYTKRSAIQDFLEEYNTERTTNVMWMSQNG
jgi:hypothetical protein